MGGATPHGGVEPSVGPKTVVVGFPRVVVVCLLALAELARRTAAAVEGMNMEALPFWIPPTPREIRLKMLNVSPTL